MTRDKSLESRDKSVDTRDKSMETWDKRTRDSGKWPGSWWRSVSNRRTHSMMYSVWTTNKQIHADDLGQQIKQDIKCTFYASSRCGRIVRGHIFSSTVKQSLARTPQRQQPRSQPFNLQWHLHPIGKRVSPDSKVGVRLSELYNNQIAKLQHIWSKDRSLM